MLGPIGRFKLLGSGINDNGGMNLDDKKRWSLNESDGEKENRRIKFPVLIQFE